jgi:hypothetical protein
MKNKKMLIDMFRAFKAVLSSGGCTGVPVNLALTQPAHCLQQDWCDAEKNEIKS